MDAPVHYTFNDHRFSPLERRLWRGQEELVVEQKVADLLHAFCRRPGQVLTKSWLMEEIWPGRIVNEDSLSVAVSKLRRVLGDRAAAPKYIRTVTGTGYLWLPETRHHATQAAGPAARKVSPRSGWWRASSLITLGLLATAAGGWWLSQKPDPAGDQAPLQAVIETNSEVGQLLEQAEQRLEENQPGALRQAIVDYRAVLQKEPDSSEAYLGIALAKLSLSALNGFLDIELYADEIHALLDRAIELDPDNAQAWLSKAELYFLADWNLDAAEQAYQRAIQISPDQPHAYLSYSELLLTKGEFERSEELIAQLRALDPAWFQFVNMSFVYVMRGELERAPGRNPPPDQQRERNSLRTANDASRRPPPA